MVSEMRRIGVDKNIKIRALLFIDYKKFLKNIFLDEKLKFKKSANSFLLNKGKNNCLMHRPHELEKVREGKWRLPKIMFDTENLLC